MLSLAWAISEKILARWYIIIGLVAAYYIWGIKIKTSSSHLVKEPSFTAFLPKTALGKLDLYGKNTFPVHRHSNYKLSFEQIHSFWNFLGRFSK